MHCITTVTELRESISAQQAQHRTIGLVPTMGNLHEGHLQLIRQARRQADWVICSIFVNPMQFGANEDLDAYPRTFAQDRARLEENLCDCVFHPQADEIYPHGLSAQTVVSVPELGAAHCGKSRPGHFDGVATVVNKLFNLCQPDVAFFGLKDYQQFLIIRKMVADLMMPIEIIGVETVREADGLAMSSRNQYLDASARRQAPALYQALGEIRDRIEAGDRRFRKLEKAASEQLRAKGLETDYIAICHADTLRPAAATDRSLAILAAAYLGRTRLIDNVRLSVPQGAAD